MQEDWRLPWVALLSLLVAFGLSLLVTARLPLLNFFYVPVLFVAYLSGRPLATAVAALAVLVVGLLALLFPESFAAGGRVAWPPLLVWGCLLVVAGYAGGTLIAALRQRGRRGGEAPPDRPEQRLYNIGTLAIIKGYLRHDQVLKILQIQQKTHRLFGEIAVGLRLLTPEQVDELLRIQEEKRSVTSSEIAMAKLEIAKARQAATRSEPPR